MRKSKKVVLVSKDSLWEMIKTHQDPGLVIGRALAALFKYQTDAEQNRNDVEVHNNVGFTPSDGRTASITAKYFLKHGKLLDWQIEKWMKINPRTGYPRICKYDRQLNDIALLKQKDKELTCLMH